MIMQRRGPEQAPDRLVWERVLVVAVDLDDLAADLSGAPEQVPRLATMVRDLLSRLPEPHVTPSLPPIVLLDGLHDAVDGAPRRAALVDCLGHAAEELARLAGAPITHHARTLKCEAAGILNGLAPLLSTWTERLADAAAADGRGESDRSHIRSRPSHPL